MCVDACPFAAITLVGEDGDRVASTPCKGCGACVPVCPADAIDVAGYTDARIKGMIDGLLGVSFTWHPSTGGTTIGRGPQNRSVREIVRDEQVMRRRILAALADGPSRCPRSRRPSSARPTK